MEFESGSGFLLLTLGAIFVSASLVRNVCHRLGLPSSVGFIVLGLLIGAVLRPIVGFGSPVFNGAFAALAQLSVVVLLFRVGLRSHTSALLEKLPDASMIWIGNALGSAAVGFLVAFYALGWTFETSLAIGTAFSATSIAVSLAVWDELGLADSPTGAMLLDVADLDDLSAAVLLAVLIGTLPAMLNGDGDLWLKVGTSTVMTLIKLVTFIVGCYLFAFYVEKGFTEFNQRMSDSAASLSISILGAGLAIAAVADYLGFSIAIGALFAGLAFSRDPEAVREEGNFNYLYEFLAPFFFIHIGMQTDLSVLFDALDVGIVLFIAAVASKLVFTYLPAVRTMPRRDALNLSISMVPRAEIALVVIYECRVIDSRIIPPDVFAGMVLVALATSILSPIALKPLLRRGSG